MTTLLLALSLAAAGAPSLELPCRRLALELPKAQLAAGAWSLDGGLLLVSDAESGRLLRFDSAGGRLPDVQPSGRGGAGFEHPSFIYPARDGFVLRDHPARLLALDATGLPLREVAFAAPGVGGVSDAVLVDGALIGRGSAREPDGSRWFGYLELGVQPYVIKRRGISIPTQSEEWNYLPAVGATVALAGAAAYALRYTAPPRIEQLFPSRHLAAFPASHRLLPKIPPALTGRGRDLEFEAFMVAARLPVRLLGQGRYLYLLTREPAGAGDTRWLVHRIDPVADHLEAAFELPTRAASLLVVAGPEAWGVFERPRVAPRGNEPPESLLLVASSWFEQRASQGAGPLAPPPCHATLPSLKPSP